MYLIDIHTHVYPDKIAMKATDSVRDFYSIYGGKMDGTTKQLLERGKEAGISKYVILPVANSPERVHGINDFIVSQLQQHEEFIGFGTVHADMTGLNEEVERILNLEVDAPLHAVGAPCGPLFQNLAHTHHPGHAGDEDIKITGEAVLQGGQPEELLHQLFRVNAPLQVDGQLQTAQIGFIAHVGDFLDLARLDELRHLVHDDFRGGGIGNLGDLDEIACLDIVPLGTELEAAPACGVDIPGGCLVKEQFCTGGKVRTG